MRLLLLFTLLLSQLWSTQLDNRLLSILQNEPQVLGSYTSDQNVIRSLYAINKNKPLWIGHAQNINDLREALQNPYFNYKFKDFYQSQAEQYSYLLNDNMNLDENSQELALLDIAFTKSYITLVNFIVKSDIDWDKVSTKISELKELKDVEAHWEMVRKSSPSSSELFSAIANHNIPGFLRSITPLPQRHQDLIDALLFYQGMRDIPQVKYGKDLKAGDQHPFIPDIKKRFALSGDLRQQTAYTDIFDKELEQALYTYKKRFKLEQNGIIDKITVYYLNKPMDIHIENIITNLDKLKVFPNQFPNEYIMVSIPDFTMDYYKDGNSILHMNAVVGRDERPTPLFSSFMTYLELNPTWTVPENLVRKDLIPALMENPNYLKEHNMHAYNGWGDNKEITNFSVDKLLPYKEKGGIPYRFVQSPGDDNALGRIKFMFPNKYTVYLHDTDNKSLFAQRYRVYSSGCMRLEQPFELLEVLKPRLKPYDVKNIDTYRNSLTTRTLNFTEKLPIYTTYFTVFKRDGLISFRKDIYGYDRFIQESVFGSNQ